MLQPNIQGAENKSPSALKCLTFTSTISMLKISTKHNIFLYIPMITSVGAILQMDTERWWDNLLLLYSDSHYRQKKHRPTSKRYFSFVSRKWLSIDLLIGFFNIVSRPISGFVFFTSQIALCVVNMKNNFAILIRISKIKSPKMKN